MSKMGRVFACRVISLGGKQMDMEQFQSSDQAWDGTELRGPQTLRRHTDSEASCDLTDEREREVETQTQTQTQS